MGQSNDKKCRVTTFLLFENKKIREKMLNLSFVKLLKIQDSGYGPSFN